MGCVLQYWQTLLVRCWQRVDAFSMREHLMADSEEQRDAYLEALERYSKAKHPKSDVLTPEDLAIIHEASERRIVAARNRRARRANKAKQRG